MLLMLIKLGFCSITIIVIGIATQYVGGAIGLGIAAIACVALPLFNWGCRQAAKEAAKQATAQAERDGVQAALSAIESQLIRRL